MNTDKTLDANTNLLRMAMTNMLDNACPADSIDLHDPSTGIKTVRRCTFIVDLHCATFMIDAWKPFDGTDSHWRITNYRVLSDPDGKVTP